MLVERALLGAARAAGLPIYAPPPPARAAASGAAGRRRFVYERPDGHAAARVRMGTCAELWPYYQPNFGAMLRYVRWVNRQHRLKQRNGKAAAAVDALGFYADEEGEGEGDGKTSARARARVRGGSRMEIDDDGSDGDGCDDDDDGSSMERHYTSALGVVPTGWAWANAYNKRNAHTQREIRGIVLSVMLSPYSEHSSFSELSAFVAALRPAKLIPTVFSSSGGAGERSGSGAEAIIKPEQHGQPRRNAASGTVQFRLGRQVGSVR